MENTAGVKLNWDSIQKRKQGVVDKHTKGLSFLARKNKVDVVRGCGKLTGAGAGRHPHRRHRRRAGEGGQGEGGGAGGGIDGAHAAGTAGRIRRSSPTSRCWRWARFPSR